MDTSNWREEEMVHYMKDQLSRELDILIERDEEMRIVRKQQRREVRTEVG